MNIHLQFSLTADDYHERRMSYRHAQQAWLKLSIIMWAIILGFAVLIVVVLRQNSHSPVGGPPLKVPQSNGRDLAGLLMIFILPLGCLVFWVYGCYSRRSKSVSRREFKSNPKLGEPLVVDLTDAHMAVCMPGSTVAMDWPQFKMLQETPSLFLVFFHPEHALILPKRAFASAQEVEEFRGFALAHVGNVPIGFPVQPAKIAETGGVSGDVGSKKG